MKIYRGPSTKPFYDESHQLVAEISVLNDNEPWTGTKILKANVSKEAVERQAVVNIAVDEKEILHLHKVLLESLFDNYDNFKSEASKSDFRRVFLCQIEMALSNNIDPDAQILKRIRHYVGMWKNKENEK
jgi:hypothetical protein